MPRSQKRSYKRRAPTRRNFGVKNAQWWMKQGMRGKRKGSIKRLARRAVNYGLRTAFKNRRRLTTGFRGNVKFLK